MNLMIELPGGKYYAVPRDVLEKYAVSKSAFESELAEKEKTGNTVFHADVEGQEEYNRPRPVVMGVRG